MLVDSRLLETGTAVEADLCIVGGGTAGLTLAREFIGAPVTVCLLESGGREPDAETGSLDEGDNIGHPYYPLDTARSRSLGGSSMLWHVPLGGDRVGARMRPLDSIDFERREWVPHSGWPFDRKALDSYYARAQAVCHVGPVGFEPGEWLDDQSLGALSAADEDVQPIVYKFCPRDVFAAKYPAEVAGAPNITTYLHASALHLQTCPKDDHVTSIQVGTLRGNQFSVRAKTFVLALGGIETPRLLLSSGHEQSGLGNRNDLVGRFFMEHPHFWSGLIVPPDQKFFERTRMFNNINTVHGTAVLAKLALREGTIRRERLLNQNIELVIRNRPDPSKYRRIDPASVESLKVLLKGQVRRDAVVHLRNVARGWRDVAATAARRVRGPLPETPVFVCANMAEQVPNPQSRVTLGSERDVFGQRKVQLNWQLTQQDIASVVRTQEILGAALERAGWGRFHRELFDCSPPPDTHGGYHHMGTTRMHDDPRQGVVDANGRIHGIANTFVAGPSVFPTGGYANPVLTIVALTLRLADHLKQNGFGAYA